MLLFTVVFLSRKLRINNYQISILYHENWIEIGYIAIIFDYTSLRIFNVFINDLFFLMEEAEVCNYADDTTIYGCGHELEHVVFRLETDAQKLSKWFLDNSVKLNPDKCHL